MKKRLSLLLCILIAFGCAFAAAAEVGVEALTEKGEELVKAGDAAAAAEVFLRAAEMGDLHALIYLGILYEQGNGVEQSYEKAAELYQKAADGGEAFGRVYLGNLYTAGKGVEQSYEKAAELYQKAADQENGEACFRLYELYGKGLGVEVSEEKAEAYLKQAFNLGNPEALVLCGTALYTAQSYEQAVQLFQLAADQGNGKGCFFLGLMYLQGQGVEQSNEQGLSYVKQAAEMGDDQALYFIGDMYYRTEQYDKAAELYRMAVEHGSGEAAEKLDQMVKDGQIEAAAPAGEN